MMPRWAILFIGALIVVDQSVKHLILSMVFDPPRIIEVSSFFNLVPVWNSGVSFGLFGDSESSRWILVGLALAIVIVLLVWMVRAGGGMVVFALTLVVGGALGNVVDRIVYGAVIDFVDIHGFGFHWPAFNVADTTIVVGTALLFYDSLFGSTRTLK
ncbi:MAG: signal peptidase II [Alphaproteobacteria bacterium]|nr:signal peptidase II [Alphaproteobacteria bacterium]